MAIKLHGRSLCPFTRAVLLALYEKDLDCELVADDKHAPEYLAKYNPFGKHPALEIDDFVLYESRAMTRFIATKYESQGTNLLRSTPEEKALVNQWVEVESQSFHPPTLLVCLMVVFIPMSFQKEGDAAVLEENCAKLDKVLDVYEAQLAKTKYLAGDFYSMADMLHLPLLHVLIDASGKGSLVTSRKHVNAWYENISSRPAWKKVLEKHTPNVI